MRHLIFIFLLSSTVAFSQDSNFLETTNEKFSKFYISGDFLQIQDADLDFEFIDAIDNLTFGYFASKRLLIGFSNEDSKADFRVEDLNPVSDSLLVSKFQALVRVYTKHDFFFQLKMPLNSNISDISVLDQVRLGVGYSFRLTGDLYFDANYDLLAYNSDKFRKGKTHLGLSVKF